MDRIVKYRNVTHNVSISIVFMVFSIFIEILSDILIMQSFPTMLMTGIALLFLVSLILFLLPNKWIRVIVSSLLITLQCVISVVNEILYRTTGELFTFAKIALAGPTVLSGDGAGGVFTMSMLRWEIIAIFLGIIALYILMAICTHKHYKVFKPTRRVFISIVMIFMISFSIFAGITAVPLTFRHDLLTMLTTQMPVTSSYKNYGYYTFYTFNIASNIISLFDDDELDESLYIEYLSTDSTPNTNDYSGVSQGNNVILILCESLEPYGIDSYFTPNLYNLMYNNPSSMNMTSYYSDNKTNMSEGLSFLGTYSSKYQLGATGSVDICNALSTVSLPSKLKSESSDIVTSYFHGLTSGFYYRSDTFDKLGFDNLYFAQDQESSIKQYNEDNNISYNWTTKNFYSFIKDSNFIEYNIDSFIPDTGRFYTQYATLSTHGTYESRGANKEFYTKLTSKANKSYYNAMISDLESKGYKPKKVATDFKYYKAAMMDLDKTIGIILDRLEATGHLEDTTMLLYADHNAYYNSLAWKMRGVDSTDISAFNLPLIIHDKKMTSKYREVNNILNHSKTIQNDSFASVMDIYPTLCNILGLDYNTKLAYGQTIFDTTPHVFMTFKDSAYIFNKDCFYDGSKTTKLHSKASVTSFQSMVDDILYKFNMQESLYKNAYTFSKIMTMI